MDCNNFVLKALDDYHKNHEKELINIKTYYENLKDFQSVVEDASNSILEIEGKRTSMCHQHKISQKKCEEAAQKLLESYDKLAAANTFEDIFAVTENVKKELHGVGKLWSYNTALRIGFNKKVYPKEIFLHAAAMKGYDKLVKNKSFIKSNKHVSKEAFCVQLQKKEAYIIEHFLCIYGKKDKYAVSI